MLKGYQIAARIRKLIKSEGVTINALGEHMGIAKSALRQAKAAKVRYFLERLEKNVIHLVELDSVADFFGKTRNDLVLSHKELSELCIGRGKRVVHGEAGSYLFIHKEDRGLLESFLTKLTKE